MPSARSLRSESVVDEIGDQAAVDRRAKRKLRERLLADRENDDVVTLRARRREIREAKVVEQQRALSKRRDMVRSEPREERRRGAQAEARRQPPTQTAHTSLLDRRRRVRHRGGAASCFRHDRNHARFATKRQGTLDVRPVVGGVSAGIAAAAAAARGCLLVSSLSPRRYVRSRATDYNDRRRARPTARGARRLRRSRSMHGCARSTRRGHAARPRRRPPS